MYSGDFVSPVTATVAEKAQQEPWKFRLMRQWLQLERLTQSGRLQRRLGRGRSGSEVMVKTADLGDGNPKIKWPGPPGWGLGEGLTTPHCKSFIVQKATHEEAGLILRRRNKQRNKGYDIRIATWNVRSLLVAGSLQNLKNIMTQYNIGILAIQEIGWKGEGIMKFGNFTVFYKGGLRNMFGTGFIVSNIFKKQVLNFTLSMLGLVARE